MIASDSAGVRILELTGWGSSVSALQLSDQPTLSLGDADSESYQLFQVTDALPLPNGEIAIANAGNSEILVFNATGQVVRRLGRSGSGPGEFRALRWLALLPPDSIVAGDISLRRLTVFSPTGTTTRIATTVGSSGDAARGGDSAPHPLGVFADGSFLAAAYDLPPAKPGPVRPAISLIRYTPDASISEAAGSWPGDELHLLATQGRLHVLSPPFARTTQVRVGADRYCVADSDRPEVQIFLQRGTLQVAVRWAEAKDRGAAIWLEEEIRQRFRNFDEGPALEQRLAEQREIASHETLPAFGEVRLGSDGRLWISAYIVPGDTAAIWAGINTDTQTITHVRIPADVQVLRFGANDVTVVARDHLERERVRRYGFSIR